MGGLAIAQAACVSAGGVGSDCWARVVFAGPHLLIPHPLFASEWIGVSFGRHLIPHCLLLRHSIVWPRHSRGRLQRSSESLAAGQGLTAFVCSIALLHQSLQSRLCY
ncbi:hypothetical protein E2C01_043920 [Portunus trituberculatus]|uniref:Uncharacterized protein n=1 Tax=Portunus trituberculatus TaxID=210409 RepID=A0A5B7FZ00_PORTR|nr:hypothetical protein [Portunus trituberculatus]